MALPPTIPTSFVPRQTAPAVRQRTGANVFLIVALLLLGLSILGAGAVFGYQKYLETVLASRTASLDKAQNSIDQGTVQDFIRLRDRLIGANTLIQNHVSVSQFLDVLEGTTLQNVRFSSMKLSIAGDHSARVEMDGTARTFNALAAESRAFAAEKHIKRAIFAGISPNKDGSVSFTVTADLDPSLLIMSAAAAQDAAAAQPPAAVPQQAATSTATSTTGL